MVAATSQQRAPMPSIGANDRLGLTVFFAVVFHSLVILGVSFSQPEFSKPPEKLPGLEVTLVNMKTDKKIEEADFLANASQEGGGEEGDPNRPTAPVEQSISTGEVGEVSEFVPETKINTAVNPQQKEIMTANRSSDHKIAIREASEDLPFERKTVSSKQLLKQSKEVARLNAEVDITRKTLSHKPRKKFLMPQTKEHVFAEYEESWRKKVERIATLNFPDEAVRRNLEGSPRLTVTIRSDGSLKSVKITKFSGHKLLDDAAIRYVKMSAPFMRFPDEMSKDYDELVIIRTFQFLPGSQRIRTQR